MHMISDNHVVTVVNLNRCHDWGKPGDVLCDRTTKWGNPFILYHEAKRDAVCDFYEKYFREITKPNNRNAVRDILYKGGLTNHQVNHRIEITGGFLDINEISDAKRLGCHCAPLRCHCDYLKKLIEALP